MYGGNCTAGYVSSAMELTKQAQVRNIELINLFITNESLITRARNCLAHIFLQSDCTHLLFVDADIAFDANQILDMLDTDKDIICGLYPKKYIRWDSVAQAASMGVAPEHLSKYGCDFTVNAIDGQQVKLSALNKTPVQVKEAGTGMMLIKREVFDKLSEQTPSFKAGMSVMGMIGPEDYIKQHFETGVNPETHRMESEDFAFCRKWREQGGEVWVAPWVELKHIGTHVFG
jgi:hypothetical protein